jgi:drug/metabolite transporter (DMT)-like permease
MEVLHKKSPNERFYTVIRFALVICVIEMFSQATLKHNRYPVLGIFGYIVLAIILHNSYYYENMGHMNLVWSCVSIITGFLVSHYFFDERINRYTLFAILLAMLAIYTAHLSDEE